MDKFQPALPVPEGVPNGQLASPKVSARTHGLTSREMRRVRRFVRIKRQTLAAALQPFKGARLGDTLREDVYRALCDAEAAVATRHGHLLPAAPYPALSVRREGDRLIVDVPGDLLRDREPTIFRA